MSYEGDQLSDVKKDKVDKKLNSYSIFLNFKHSHVGLLSSGVEMRFQLKGYQI